MQQDYTYAVARIRFKETKLLSDADLNMLLAARDTEEVLRLLRDKGWGEPSETRCEAILAQEEEKLWAFVAESVEELSSLHFLLAPNDFHNLKVAVKCITRSEKNDGLMLRNAIVPPDKLYRAVETRAYQELPAFLSGAAKEAMTVLLQTSDGQLCDVVVDKACMEYVYQLGKESDNEIIRLYCELFVASADIKVAIRCANTKKKRDFIRRAMAQCDSLDIEKLCEAAVEGRDAVLAYLGTTEYRSAVDAVNTSMSAFEKWCDDRVTAVMKPQKWEPFGIGPIVAYIIARQNEIKAVRMILSAKLNHLSEDTIRERLRSMYV